MCYLIWYKLFYKVRGNYLCMGMSENLKDECDVCVSVTTYSCFFNV